MKTGRIALAVGAIVGGMSLWSPAVAQTAQFPTVARSYVAWMVRAMDECSPPNLSVIGGPNEPSGGCLQSNSVTDDQMTMNFARLIVNARSGRVIVFGRGFPFGARVRVQLTLRVTKLGQTTKHPPASNQRVTFEDQVVFCPGSSSPFGFTVRPGGVLFGGVALSDCLAPDTGLATGNIEIIDSALENKDNGRIFAHPGVLR